MKTVARIVLAAFAAFSPALAAGDLTVVETPVTIANGTSLSASVDLGANRVFGVVMPAAWTAAGLTFQGSSDGINFFDLFDDGGTEVSVTVAASKFVVLAAPVKMLSVRWIKVRSGTTGSPVNQGADRIVKLVGVP